MFQNVGIGTGPDGSINQMQARFGGLRFIVDANCLEETDKRLFPVSKNRSKRIHKKLLKRFGGEFRKAPAVFRSGDTIYLHPSRKADLERSIANHIVDK